MAALLSPEKAVERPRMLAKQTQYKRSQSLLHTSSLALLSESDSMTSKIFT
jgi:hypothetical protein